MFHVHQYLSQSRLYIAKRDLRNPTARMKTLPVPEAFGINQKSGTLVVVVRLFLDPEAETGSLVETNDVTSIEEINIFNFHRQKSTNSLGHHEASQESARYGTLILGSTPAKVCMGHCYKWEVV